MPCNFLPQRKFCKKDGYIKYRCCCNQRWLFLAIPAACILWVARPRSQKLVETTYEAMLAGIHTVRPGATLGDIGYAIQSCCRLRVIVLSENIAVMVLVVFIMNNRILHYGQKDRHGIEKRHGIYH